MDTGFFTSLLSLWLSHFSTSLYSKNLVSIRDLLWFAGRGCQRVWNTCAIPTVLDLGKTAKSYISPKQTLDASGGNTIGNFIFYFGPVTAFSINGCLNIDITFKCNAGLIQADEKSMPFVGWTVERGFK